MAAQKLKQWQKTEGKEEMAEKLSEDIQAAQNGPIQKEDLICLDQATKVPAGSKDIQPRSTWKKGP